jgi:hypothetical protein
LSNKNPKYTEKRVKAPLREALPLSRANETSWSKTLVLQGLLQHAIHATVAQSVFVKYLLSPYTHLGDVEEIFNPLGVSLGASES